MMRIVLVLLLCACSNKADKAPSCAEVTDHMLAIVNKAYAGHGDMGAQGNRDAQIQQCEARNVGAAERRCILTATTMEGIAQCRRGSMKEPGSGASPTTK